MTAQRPPLLGALVAAAALAGAGATASARQAAPAEAPAPPGPDERLAVIETRLADALLERRPWLARERGIDRRDRGLGRYGPDSYTWWTALLESTAAELAAIDGSKLGAERRTELEWVRSWVRVEHTLTFYRAAERWDPHTYVERADQVLRGLVETDTADVKERAAAVLEVLAELPKLWQTTRRGLVSPSEVLCEEAGAHIEDLVAYLRTDVPRFLRELKTPQADAMRAVFDRAQRLAISESIDLRKWLIGTPFDVRPPTSSMGKDNWQAAVRALVGGDATASELRARVLRELATIDNAMGDRKGLAELGAAELRPRDVPKGVLAGARQATTVATLAGAFGEGSFARATLLPRVHTGHAVPRPWATLRAGEGSNWILEIESGGEDWPEPLARTRRALLNPAAQAVLGMRYGMPGVAMLRASALRHEHPGQRVLGNRANADGFGLYVLDWLHRVDWVENALAADETVRREALRARQIEAARFLSAMEVHVEDLPLVDVVESFRRRTGFDEASARNEVLGAMHDPLYGIGFLGASEIRRIEDAFTERLGRKRAMLETLRLLTEFPSARPVDLLRWVVPTRGEPEPAPAGD